MTEIIQGILDFDNGNLNGYENLQREKATFKEKVRQEWSVPLEKTVRIKLKGIDEDFEGTLKLVRNPVTINHKKPIQLKIGKTEFLSTDIKQCTVLP